MRRRTRSRSFASSSSEQLELRALLATITVTSLADNVTEDGLVTLREAVEAANTDSSVDGSTAGNGLDTIEFAAGLSGTVELSRGTLVVRTPMRIFGHGSSDTIIDGAGGTRLLRVNREIGAGPVFLELQDLTLRGGQTASQGAAIYANARETTLILRRVTLADNTAEGNGGAVAFGLQFGVLTVEDSHFANNTSNSAGGAIRVGAAGTLAAFRNTEFSENTAEVGGAIGFGAFSTGTIEDSLFVGNTASAVGGAIASPLQSDFRVFRSDFHENSADRGGAIYGGQGAGEADSATVEIFDSYIARNTARSASAIDVFEGSLSNSTVTANTSEGSTISSVFDFDVTNSTIAANTGTGASLGRQSEVESSILSGNILSGVQRDLQETQAVVRNSLIGVNTGTTLVPAAPDADGNLVGSTAVPADPMLLPQVDFGRGMTVLPLQNGSPAEDGGTNPNSLTTDQRGAARVQGTDADMGAFEGPVRGVVAITGQPVVPEGDSGTTNMTFTLTYTGTAGAAFTVDVTTVDGTATANNDYQNITESLSFSGVPNQTIDVVVPITGDTDFELSETLSLEITAVSDANVLVSTPSATGTIQDDDDNTGIQFSDGVLLVNGTETADSILLKQIGSQLAVILNAESRTFDASEVTRIEANTGEGNDTVTALLVTAPMYVETGNGNDIVQTGDGDDTVLAGPGDDRVRGAAGNDRIEGGTGDDFLQGQEGDDTVMGNEGADNVRGQAGSDELHGGNGPDSLVGGGGRDELRGDAGSDTLKGGSGSDDVDGGPDADILKGGTGADTLTGGAGADDVNGGAGKDTIEGGEDNDTLNGSRHNDVLHGNAGDDLIIGSDGADRMFGGDGHDILRGGEGADRMFGEAGDDQLLAGSGHDDVSGGDGADELSGGSGNDQLHGDADDDVLIGGTGRDQLVGGNGEDLLTGGTGRDALFGGRSRDTLLGGAGEDLLVSGFIRMAQPLEEAFVRNGVTDEWFSQRTYDERVSNIRRSADRTLDLPYHLLGLNRANQNVFDDGRPDQVSGGEALDYFFVTTGGGAADLFDRTDDERTDLI